MILVFRELTSLHICERRVGSGRSLLADQVPRALWENEFGEWRVKFNVIAIVMNLLHSIHENRPKGSWAGSAHVVPAFVAVRCTSGSLQQVQTEVTDVRPIKKNAVCNQHC